MRRSLDLDALSDEELMTRATGGEARAFELLFDRHARMAFSLAYRVCRRRAMAEDVVQEAYLTLWRNSARYDHTRGGVRPWLMSIVHSRAIDALRRAKLRDGVDPGEHTAAEPTSPEGLIESEVLRREEAQRIRSALAGLPAAQRQAIELAYFCGLTHLQIAAALQLPAGTVKGRIRLGMEKLGAALAPGLAADRDSLLRRCATM